jgi:putative RNA 2'-phosphotransferase
MNVARGHPAMLRQCKSHGHFSGTNCPVCNEEGKFIMSDREAGSLGRILALVLRHAPEKFDVDMDINGWVATRDLSNAIANSRRHLHWVRAWHFEAIANADEKGRWQVENEMIRATYGHSIEIELDLPTDDIPDALYWPCEQGEVDSLLQFGILSGSRKHIHLSLTIANALEAGRVRIDRPAILEVDTIRAIAEGHTIFRAGTTVFLTEEVPPSALFQVEADDPAIQDTFARWDEEE